MSCAMSSSLYGGLHLYRSPAAEEEPTAAELLEATKRLYVKTDVLKDTKIDACTPRLFHSPTHDEPSSHHRRPRIVAVKPSGSGFRPSPNSAFRPIVKEVAPVVEIAVDDVVEDFLTPPPRPPKSTRVKQRVRRLHNDSICPISGQHRGSPPPLPPRRFTEADKLSTGYELSRRKSAPAADLAPRPVPAPRLSKLSSASTNSQPTPPPQPLPRRRTIQIDGSFIRVDDMSKSSPDLAISPRLLSPNSSRHSPCLPSTLIRKRMAPSLVRPATPLPAHEGVSVAPARDQRPTPSPHGHSSHGHGRRMTQTMLSLPSGSVPLSSPTSTGKATSKDSGVQPSDEEEDYRKHSSSLSEEVVVEDDDDSIFTSITNQPRREETAPALEEPSALSSTLSRPLSVIEKHTRIITWIKSSATVPPEDEHTTHHHNELTV